MALEDFSLYRQTLANRQNGYDAAIARGQYTPYLYPWDTLPALYLFFAVAVTPRLDLSLARVVRYTAFLLILLHGAYVVSRRRTLWFAGGYGIGLSTAWGIIMSGAVLVCNDLERDFKRLEARYTNLPAEHHEQNGSAARTTASDAGTTQEADLTRRNVDSIHPLLITKQTSASSEQPAIKPYRLHWQGYPYGNGSPHLIDWTVDLMTSFRGVGWKHRISTTGSFDIPLPPDGTEGNSHGERDQESKAASISASSLRNFQLRAVQVFLLNYLALDLLKTTVVTDPYFLGLAPLESPSPWLWLARLNEVVPIATRFVRLLISMAGVISALSCIFSLNPLFFTTILPGLVDITRITKAPLLEPGLYPRMWYPLTTSILRSGLGGLWGKFWHQMFRFGISEPSRVLIKKLKLNPRSNAARMIQLFIAFGLSGSIHALGSYTSFSPQKSHPLPGPLLFFLLQALGVFLQTSVISLLNKSVPWTRSTPSAARQTLNLLYVLIWLYFTGPLLADDFARCGIWLYEPLPISPLRGLGFGPGGKDEGWWTWYQEGSRLMGWWQGSQWWNSAVAVY